MDGASSYDPDNETRTVTLPWSHKMWMTSRPSATTSPSGRWPMRTMRPCTSYQKRKVPKISGSSSKKKKQYKHPVTGKISKGSLCLVCKKDPSIHRRRSSFLTGSTSSLRAHCCSTAG
ncbi:hypothetical protein EDB89DRAFT_2243585 [Lactarius sanguifluus]|nr:hypothetical protein EDB89DRAFT_2243585 [Lactarius sanguifluus]